MAVPVTTGRNSALSSRFGSKSRIQKPAALPGSFNRSFRRLPVPVRVAHQELGAALPSTAPSSSASFPGAPRRPVASNPYEFVAAVSKPELLQSSIACPLSPEEGQSLLRVLNARSSRLDVLGNLDKGLPDLKAHLLEYLENVGHTHTSQLVILEGAMLLLEQLYLLEAKHTPVSEPALTGSWQMVFTTAGSWPSRLQYIPVLEFFHVCPDKKHFSLDTKIGPLYTTFFGDLEWHTGDFLHYHCTDIKVEAFGHEMHTSFPIPDNDLKVFALGKETAVVRSSNGGLNLMVRPF